MEIEIAKLSMTQTHSETEEWRKIEIYAPH